MPAAPPRLIERSVHAVAALEWLKGLAALALAFGFDTLHRLGLHEVAVALVGHLHLNAHSHWPALFVGWSDHLQHVHPGQVVAFALAYAAMRLAEGWGLWHDRAWAEWRRAATHASSRTGSTPWWPGVARGWRRATRPTIC